jgi:hypothetical protein
MVLASVSMSSGQSGGVAVGRGGALAVSGGQSSGQALECRRPATLAEQCELKSMLASIDLKHNAYDDGTVLDDSEILAVRQHTLAACMSGPLGAQTAPHGEPAEQNPQQDAVETQHQVPGERKIVEVVTHPACGASGPRELPAATCYHSLEACNETTTDCSEVNGVSCFNFTRTVDEARLLACFESIGQCENGRSTLSSSEDAHSVNSKCGILRFKASTLGVTSP